MIGAVKLLVEVKRAFTAERYLVRRTSCPALSEPDHWMDPRSAVRAVHATCGLTGRIEEAADDHVTDADFDPERLAVCAYWRCGVLFERRSVNQRFCRKACRSRNGKWQRAQERRAAREAAKQHRRKR